MQKKLKKKKTKVNKKIIFFIIIILLILFLFSFIYNYNSKNIKNNFQQNNNDYFQNKKNTDVILSLDIYNQNNKIDVKKLNNYLNEIDASWRAGDSEFTDFLDQLSSDQANEIIAGVKYYPDELLPITLNSIKITGDDILSDKYLEYLNITSNTLNENLESSFSAINSQEDLKLYFAVEEYSDLNILDFKRKLGKNNENCSVNYNDFDYKYPFSVTTKDNEKIKFACACINDSVKKNIFYYGYEICENGKTKSFNIDEFEKYLSNFTFFNDNYLNTLKNCYPSDIKKNYIKYNANYALNILNSAFVDNKYKGGIFFDDYFETKGYSKSFLENKNVDEIKEILEDHFHKYYNYAFDCPVDFSYPPIYKDEFFINSNTPIKNQSSCGSCVANATASALEMYNFHNFGKTIIFSPQYLISQTNNFGCSGIPQHYYLDYISFYKFQFFKNEFNNFYKDLYNNYNKMLLKAELYNSISNLKNNNKSYMFSVIKESTIPLGIPEEKDSINLRYKGYDACEFNSKEEYLRSALYELNIKKKKNYSYDEVCPNNKDFGSNVASAISYEDVSNKYFIENYFEFDFKKYCYSKDISILNEIIMKILKETNSPLLISINMIQSLGKYKSGIWAPISSDVIAEHGNLYAHASDDSWAGHAVILYGWGTDLKTNKKYWLIQNSWGKSWGENGTFKVWMENEVTDNDNLWLNLICGLRENKSKKLYGLVGKLNTINESELKSIENSIEEFKINIDFSKKTSSYLESMRYDLSKQPELDDNKSIEKPVMKNKGVEDSIYINAYIQSQACAPNSEIPIDILQGICKKDNGDIGFTGNDFYYKHNLDKILFNNVELSDDTCDYGKYYCDQSQIRITINKKLDLLSDSKNYIQLNDLKFKSVCVDLDNCFIIESKTNFPIKQINNLINLDSSSKQSNNNKIIEKINFIPDFYLKYLIIRTSFNFNTDVTENDADTLISLITNNTYNSYYLDNKKYYEFSALSYVNTFNLINKLYFNSTSLKLLIQFNNNLDIFFGNCLNSFLIVPKIIGDLKPSQNIYKFSNHKIFTNDIEMSFLKNYFFWKINLSQTSPEDTIQNYGLYEIKLLDDERNDLEKKVDYTIEMKQLYSIDNNFSNIPLFPFNNSITAYEPKDSKTSYLPEFNEGLLFTNSLIRTDYSINLNYSPSIWNKLKTGNVLQFKNKFDFFWNDLEINKTKPIKLFFDSTPKSKYSYNINYIDEKGKSQALEINSTKTEENIYLYDAINNNDFGQIQIVLNCNEKLNECPKVFIENTPFVKKQTNTGYIYTIPDDISYDDDATQSIEKIFKSIKEGKICLSHDNDNFYFWHNPNYFKYSSHYENIISTGDNQINLQNYKLENYFSNTHEFFIFNYLPFISENSTVIINNDSQELLFVQNLPVSLTIDSNFSSSEPIYVFAIENLDEDVLSLIYSDLDKIIKKDTKEFVPLKNNYISLKNDIFKGEFYFSSNNISINSFQDTVYLLILQISQENEIKYIKTSNITIKKTNKSRINIIDDLINYEFCKLNKKILCFGEICDLSVNCGDTFSLNIQDYLGKKYLLLNNEMIKKTEFILKNGVCSD